MAIWLLISGQELISYHLHSLDLLTNWKNSETEDLVHQEEEEIEKIEEEAEEAEEAHEVEEVEADLEEEEEVDLQEDAKKLLNQLENKNDSLVEVNCLKT